MFKALEYNFGVHMNMHRPLKAKPTSLTRAELAGPNVLNFSDESGKKWNKQRFSRHWWVRKSLVNESFVDTVLLHCSSVPRNET